MDANKLISKLKDCVLDNKGFSNITAVIHLGEGIILPIESIGTDAEGAIYIDCDGKEYLKQKEGKVRDKPELVTCEGIRSEDMLLKTEGNNINVEEIGCSAYKEGKCGDNNEKYCDGCTSEYM